MSIFSKRPFIKIKIYYKYIHTSVQGGYRGIPLYKNKNSYHIFVGLRNRLVKIKKKKTKKNQKFSSSYAYVYFILYLMNL